MRTVIRNSLTEETMKIQQKQQGCIVIIEFCKEVLPRVIQNQKNETFRVFLPIISKIALQLRAIPFELNHQFPLCRPYKSGQLIVLKLESFSTILQPLLFIAPKQSAQSFNQLHNQMSLLNHIKYHTNLILINRKQNQTQVSVKNA